MKALSSLRLSPLLRLTVGLVALMFTLFVFFDAVLGIVPDRAAAQRDLRQRMAEIIAVQVATLIEAGDERTLGKTIQQVVVRNPEVLSIAVRQASGYLLAQQGDHKRHWAPSETRDLAADRIRVPIQSGQGRWGDVEIAFVPLAPRTWTSWLRDPVVMLLLALSVGGLLVIYPFLRRSLSFLDPSAVLPDRVRRAFDALTGGVVVIDAEGRIVLANKAFREVVPDHSGELHGRPLSDFSWLQSRSSDAGESGVPWQSVFADGKPLAGLPVSIPGNQDAPIRMIVGCSPIADNERKVRGCLLTFDDVTDVHRANENLRRTLVELEQSKAMIQQQNVDLQILATRDPLTGCLNRRAFFEAATPILDAHAQTGGETSCIMGDIDHFKRFNDLYGHSVGDQVIQVVSRTMLRCVRGDDLLCRYGGEEFCILLPHTGLGPAWMVAERIRSEIEAKAVQGVRGVAVGPITSSFGVSSLSQGATTIKELIDFADNALYQSKENGRNRVTSWTPEAGTDAVES